MDLKEILAIGGKPGLYKLIARGRDGVVVEHLSEGKRMKVGGNAQVSALGDIAIFTAEDEKPLADVLKAIYDKTQGQKTISHKSSANELQAFFDDLIPDYDRDRVYQSDIRKIISWYNTLIENNMLQFEEVKPESKAPEKKKAAPAKKTEEGEGKA